MNFLVRTASALLQASLVLYPAHYRREYEDARTRDSSAFATPDRRSARRGALGRPESHPLNPMSES